MIKTLHLIIKTLQLIEKLSKLRRTFHIHFLWRFFVVKVERWQEMSEQEIQPKVRVRLKLGKLQLT